MRLVERDYIIIREIERWDWCLSRHIKELAGFKGDRACYRRLKILLDNGYIERKKILYGFPSLYLPTKLGKKIINAPARETRIRIEQITHDSYVLDTVIYFIHKHNIALDKITSEKQLHSLDGFSNRKHRPDFQFIQDEKKCCVEVECSAKSKQRLENNIKDNFLNYDIQYWILPNTNVKSIQILNDNMVNYPNIEILKLEEVESYSKLLQHHKAD